MLLAKGMDLLRPGFKRRYNLGSFSERQIRVDDDVREHVPSNILYSMARRSSINLMTVAVTRRLKRIDLLLHIEQRGK